MLLLAVVLMAAPYLASAQGRTVTGTVVDPDGYPIAGAAIMEKGTVNGAVTDGGGNFTLTLEGAEQAQLEIRSLGYITQTLDVGGRSRFDVKLAEDAVMLDAVVSVGYGTVKQKDLTTSVAIVSTKDVDTRPVTSVSSVLQGKAAGVQVIQPNGAPGQGMVVRVRGASSLSSSNDPLYVVDGVPVGEGNYAIAYLSPNEIETMQVLKDASSAAIYGSRGANGVVLITTKQGNKKKGVDISFSSFVGISKVARTYDVLDAQQYRELMEESGAIAGLPAGLTDQTDWFDQTFSTGVNQNYQFSASNATDKSSYYLGGGYTNEKGIIKTTSAERYNVKASFDTQLYKWVSANASVMYSNYTSRGGIITGQGANRAGVVISAITTPTYAPVWDVDNPGQYHNDFYGANLTSPSENMARTDHNYNTTDRLLASGGLNFNILEGLTFRSTVTMDRRWVHDFSYLDPLRTDYGRTQHGTASEERSDDMRMVYDNILTWNKSLGRHNLEIIGGTSATTSRWENLTGSRSYFSTENTIPNLNGGNNGGLRGQGSGKSEWAIMSYLGRVSYNYDSRYLVSANFRADGSSKLAPKHRWGYFPSFSAAWRISGENFMRDIRWISDLKLRAGWGQTGNQSGLSEYGYLQRYNTVYYNWTQSGFENAVPTIGDKSNIKNEELTWETTTQTGIGLDFAVLSNRLSFSMDYYYKYTKDLLLSVPMPNPYPNLVRNEAEMSNRGFEFTVSSVNFARKDFRWTTDFNISFNRNRLEKLTLKTFYPYGKTSDITNQDIIHMVPGQPLSMFWGYISDGVDPETGDLIYRDINKNGKDDDGDQTWIGNANPKFTAGLSNNISWKGLNVNILITSSYGNDIFNAARIETEGMINGNNQTTEVLRRWKIPGQVTDMPRATTDAHNLRNSTRWVEDGSFIKVKNISISYDFSGPRLRRLNISRIQPYVSLQNFLTLTKYSGYDPEVSQWEDATRMGIDWGTYPNVRTVVVGVNLNF